MGGYRIELKPQPVPHAHAHTHNTHTIHTQDTHTHAHTQNRYKIHTYTVYSIQNTDTTPVQHREQNTTSTHRTTQSCTYSFDFYH